MCMMSFIELQKTSALSFKCIMSRLFVVQNGFFAKN